MAIQRFSLGPGGPLRLTIAWRGAWQDLRVLLDDEEVGSVPRLADLSTGTDVPLPDGSVLSLRVDGRIPEQELEVRRDGRLLGDAVAEQRRRVRRAGFVSLAMAGLVLFALQLLDAASLVRGRLDEALVELSVLLVLLGVLMLRSARRLLIAALALYAITVAFGLAFAVALWAFPSHWRLGVRAVALYAMFRGGGALGVLERAEDARPRVPYPLPPELAPCTEATMPRPDEENPFRS